MKKFLNLLKLVPIITGILIGIMFTLSITESNWTMLSILGLIISILIGGMVGGLVSLFFGLVEDCEEEAPVASKKVRGTSDRQKHFDILYRLARHIRNTDSMPAIEWGGKGMELLAELRELDPTMYDRLVKKDNE
jgi:hypothetical protein